MDTEEKANIMVPIDTEEVNKHHNGENQEYLVSATPILADVFIS